MPTKAKKTKKIVVKRRRQTNNVNKLEDLAPELFFDIFDYLTGNQIYKSFLGLNEYLDELVHHTPNVHLDLCRIHTKFYRHFQDIFSCENIVSTVLLYVNVNIMTNLFNFTPIRRFKSLTLLQVPLREFESKIPEILRPFRHQLIHLKIEFSDMHFTKTGADAAQSFAYLLTELSMLRSITLHYFDGIDSLTYLPSNIINTTISTLDISLLHETRLIPLLYRFKHLKVLRIHSIVSMGRRAGPADAIMYYRNLLKEKTTIDYPIPCRHINVYNYRMDLNRVAHLFELIISPSLLTLCLWMCQRPEVRRPIPKRQPPFLDGPEWHNLLSKYLLMTMKKFYIEYEDTDQTMSLSNLNNVRKKFAQLNRLDPSWHVTCARNENTKQLSFTFSPRNC